MEAGTLNQQTDHQNTPQPSDPTKATASPPETAPGAGERISTQEARGARKTGVWKILAASLVIVVIGFALVALFTGSPTPASAPAAGTVAP